MNVVLLSLGSNVDPERNLPAAVRLLRERTRVLAVSGAYETDPVGTMDPRPFLNAAVRLATELPLDAFRRDVVAAVERELGRVRDPADRNAPRTIDLDVSLWEGAAGTLADPDVTLWAHVAVPLSDVAPGRVLPGDGRTIAQVAADLLADAPTPRPRPDVDLRAVLAGG